MRGTRTSAAIAAAITLSALIAGCGSGSDPGSPDIIIGEGQDAYPTITASDWVTYADHVFVVTPSHITETTPGQAAIDAGEGTIGRTITLKVEEVLWSSDSPAKAAPELLDVTTIGWEFTDGDTNNRREMALDDQPRVEPGHTYIAAMKWTPAWCEPGDSDYIPANWSGLGSDSIIPYDDGMIGNGEHEGTTRTADQTRDAAPASDDPNFSLEDELTGKSADALKARLTTAAPIPISDRIVHPTEDGDCG